MVNEDNLYIKSVELDEIYNFLMTLCFMAVWMFEHMLQGLGSICVSEYLKLVNKFGWRQNLYESCRSK